jgi:hypothetical protein
MEGNLATRQHMLELEATQVSEPARLSQSQFVTLKQ